MQLLDARGDRACARRSPGASSTGRAREETRIGDHRWWISDLSAFQRDYPDWASRYDIEDILREIHDANVERWAAAREPLGGHPGPERGGGGRADTARPDRPRRAGGDRLRDRGHRGSHTRPAHPQRCTVGSVVSPAAVACWPPSPPTVWRLTVRLPGTACQTYHLLPYKPPTPTGSCSRGPWATTCCRSRRRAPAGRAARQHGAPAGDPVNTIGVRTSASRAHAALAEADRRRLRRRMSNVSRRTILSAARAPRSPHLTRSRLRRVTTPLRPPADAAALTPVRRLELPLERGCKLLPGGHGTWSDGGESRIAAIVGGARDRSSMSDELAAYRSDWIEQYHLAPERANVVRCLDIPPGSAVLEVAPAAVRSPGTWARSRGRSTRSSRRPTGRRWPAPGRRTCPASRSSSASSTRCPRSRPTTWS